MDRRSFGAAVASLLASCGLTRAASKKPVPRINLAAAPATSGTVVVYTIEAAKVNGVWRWANLVDTAEYPAGPDAIVPFARHWEPDYTIERHDRERLEQRAQIAAWEAETGRRYGSLPWSPNDETFATALEKIWIRYGLQRNYGRPLTPAELAQHGLS